MGAKNTSSLADYRLAERLPIPICTSALVQIPSIITLLPKLHKIAILTYDGERLGDLHLNALGIDKTRVRVYGMPSSGYLRAVIQKGEMYDHKKLESEMVESARYAVDELEGQGQRCGAIVLECTQMPPFAEAIQTATGRPVYDVFTLGMWFYSGLVRRSPQSWSS